MNNLNSKSAHFQGYETENIGKIRNFKILKNSLKLKCGPPRHQILYQRGPLICHVPILCIFVNSSRTT